MKSPLITEEVEKQLTDVLTKLTGSVEMVCVGITGEKSFVEMSGMVQHISGLSEQISCRILPVEEALEELDTELLPVTAVYKEGEYTGISFHGVTGGQELNALVLALYNTAGPGQKIGKRLERKLEAINQKLEIKVFVSLSCHHCAKQVIACQQIAAKAPGVSAAMIDARLYPALAEQYQIERIPMTVINDKQVLLGVKTPEEMYHILSGK